MHSSQSSPTKPGSRRKRSTTTADLSTTWVWNSPNSYAQTESWWGMAGDSVCHFEGAADGVLAAVEGDALEERLQDLRAGDGGTKRRDGERGGALSGGLQKVAA